MSCTFVSCASCNFVVASTNAVSHEIL